MASTLNPALVNLTKSIALAESGNGGMTPNYYAVGDNGTSKGAYQFNGDNFQTWAKQYGYDPNDFSPENQNKVAYARVSDLHGQGLSPAQIAAAWNMGETGAKNGSWQQNIGTTLINGKKISFNTPQYVQKVNSIYKQLASSEKSTTPAAPSTPSDSPLKDFETQAENALAEPLLNVTSAIQTGLDQTVGRGVNMLSGKGNVPTTENNALNFNSPKGQEVQAKLAQQPKGAAGEAGKVIGTVAPYMTGAGEEVEAPTLAAKVGSFATRMAANTAIGTAQTKSLVQGVGTALGGEALSVAATPLKALAGTIGKMFIPKSDAEAGALQAYKAGTSFVSRVGNYLANTSKAPTTAASTAFEKGLIGTESMIGVQAKRAQNKLWSKIINPALKESGVKVDMREFLSSTEKAIKQNTPELTRQKTLLDALDSIKEDYAGVKKVSLSELQKFKEGWADFVPEKAYKGQPIAGALNEVRSVLADQARTHIYTALGDNVKQAYLDYGNLYGITAMGRKAMAGGIVKAGGTFTGIKNLLERAVIPFSTLGGQTLYKVGQLGEFAGAAGAATLRDLLLGNGGATTSQNPQSQIPNTTTQPQSTPPTQ